MSGEYRKARIAVNVLKMVKSVHQPKMSASRRTSDGKELRWVFL